MKKIIFKTILLSIVFLLLSASNTQVLSISTKTQNDYDFTPVDDLLKGTVDTIPLDGCVLLLIKDEEIIYEKAFGSYTLDTVVTHSIRNQMGFSNSYYGFDR